ncbi:peroxiredoxin-like family protein [Pleionea mediterranea]|uniref:thioredoxin-dependent peroxiredoxin n=1 Tax=Pleionea mediterranea TaxID=523701 RepID=A0A316FHV1_9GAMM|nr:peroxiredoxin-like family protein [Pleionea mediterranea]PWK47843.1 peroxiredoxin [Pleionea mediterranea]
MKTNLLLSLVLFISSGLLAEQRTSIADTADDVHPLLVGQTVPDVPVWSPEGKPLSLTKMAADKPMVLVFYRGGWCPYCNHQLNELQDIEDELVAMGYRLVAISPELPDNLKKMQSERDLSYTLLSDFRIEVARAFGLAFRMKDKTADMYKEKLNADLQKFKGEQKYNLPVPGVFVVDTDGVIQFSYVNPNYAVRLHPELLLKAAEVALKGENVRKH